VKSGESRDVNDVGATAGPALGAGLVAGLDRVYANGNVEEYHEQTRVAGTSIDLESLVVDGRKPG
jgi:hypothetical protein